VSGCVIAGISVAVALLTAVIIGLLVLVVGLAYFRSSVSLQFYQLLAAFLFDPQYIWGSISHRY